MTSTTLKNQTMNFGRRLRKLRKQAGYNSTSAFAQAINRSNGYVSKIESLDYDGYKIKKNTLDKICEVLNIRPNELYAVGTSEDLRDSFIQLSINQDTFDTLLAAINYVKGSIKMTTMDYDKRTLDDYESEALVKMIMAELFSRSTQSPLGDVYEVIHSELGKTE